MGGVLSPTLCNLYMDTFKIDVLTSYDLKPRVWLWCADDIFYLWERPLSELMKLKGYLNLNG